VKLARFSKTKATCFLSYMEYRPNTNKSNIMKCIYTWICHNETPYIVSYLKQIKMPFLKTKSENRMARQVLSGGLVPVGGLRI
jgi:hypothetical protein